MKFTIAPDSFKNCLSAIKVGTYIADGILEVFPDAECKVIPIADGGEGTVSAIISSAGGKIVKVRVHDPLMRKVDSFFGILNDNSTAVIEMASASGIELIAEHEQNPMLTTTYGTGELIKHALDAACTKIIIGIGGSATNDGGVGMAMALGVKFLNTEGKAIGYGAKSLNQISCIDTSEIDERLKQVKIEVACDVKNTLCGETGASKVYGPQKGASQEMITDLDNGLYHLAGLVQEQLKIDILNLQGGGAAGGLGAGLVAFTHARLLPGFKIISSILKLETEIKNADVVISAEGAIDFQTQYGKTPAGVASMARKYKKPVFVFAGTAADNAAKIDNKLIDVIIPITRRPVDLETALKHAPLWLKQSAKELARTLKIAINLT